MGYLYSMFKNQVDEFCEFSEMDNCKDELTRYGLKRLREMDENSLDEMDPYQRGANSISKYLDEICKIVHSAIKMCYCTLSMELICGKY